MVSLDQLRLFIRIAERLSLSQAAADLSIPQSTATRWLRLMEEDFGSPLVRRTTRRMHLTDTGQKVLAYARDAVNRELLLRHSLAGTERGLQGKLVVGAPATLGTLIMVPLVTEFLRENPDLEVDMRLTERMADLVAEKIDLTVRIGEVREQQLIRSHVTILPEAIACHPELALGIDRNDPSQVQRLPWIRLSSLVDGPSVTVRRDQTTLKLDVKPRLWLDNGIAMRQAMLDRAGATLIHRYTIANDLAKGDLVELLPAWRSKAWPVSVVMPSGQRDPRVQEFAGFLRARLKSVLNATAGGRT